MSVVFLLVVSLSSREENQMCRPIPLHVLCLYITNTESVHKMLICPNIVHVPISVLCTHANKMRHNLAEHLQRMPMMGAGGNQKLVNTILGLPVVPQMNSQASLAFLTLSLTVES